MLALQSEAETRTRAQEAWGGQPKRQPEPTSPVKQQLHEQKRHALEQHLEKEVGSAHRRLQSQTEVLLHHQRPDRVRCYHEKQLYRVYR